MDKFEIKTAFNRVKYDKKIDHGNMANVNDILYANPMQGVMEQIQDVVHQSDLAHDNFIKECIVSVGIDPNALIETAKLNAKLQYELKLLRMGLLRREDRWISVDERLPEMDPRGKGRYGDARSVRVLCACKQRDGRTFVKEGYYEPCGNGNVFWRIPGSIDSVTHWMPLPSPPEKEENND